VSLGELARAGNSYPCKYLKFRAIIGYKPVVEGSNSALPTVQYPVVKTGDVVQLVRTLPCHGRGRGFESRRPRHPFQTT
jgi:hypothetical protein